MFLRRIFKGIPDMGPWLSVAEMFAALATVIGVLVGLNVVPNPFVHVSSGTISGVVTDVATSKPVPESTVQIVDNASRMMISECVPDARGNFTETVKPGAYTVKAVCDGYKPSAKSVSVLENKSRIVNLAIKQQTQAEAKAAAAAQAGGVPQTRVVTVPVVVPSGDAGRPAPSGAGARSSGASASTGTAGKSKEALAQEQYDLAKQYHEQGKLQEAEDACLAAIKYDPTDGRFYKSLIRINLERDPPNVAAAKDYRNDGRKYAKKNLKEMEDAISEIPSE